MLYYLVRVVSNRGEFCFKKRYKEFLQIAFCQNNWMKVSRFCKNEDGT